MIPHRDVRMDLMNSRQVAEYLKGNDMVILPIGCFEMHGPVIPLACDAYHAWAIAILLAEKWKCLTLPPVWYMYPGASGPWPGTVEISPEISTAYIKAIAQALLKNGFRRVVLCGTHGPLSFLVQPVIRSIYQETGQVVLFLNPQLMPAELMQARLGYEEGEDIAVLAALKVLGLHGALDPACAVDKPMENPQPQIAPLRKMGATMPFIFTAGHMHTGIRSCVKLGDAEKGIAVMREVVDGMGELPALFARYQEQMQKMNAEKPWSKDSAWQT